MKNLAILAVAALSLSACGIPTPQSEETAVNMVEIQDGNVVRVSEKGPNTIVCQDYWEQFTFWDRALSWPSNMTSEDATAVCRSREQMATEAPTARPLEPIYNTRKNYKDPVLRDAANASVGENDIRAK